MRRPYGWAVALEPQPAAALHPVADLSARGAPALGLELLDAADRFGRPDFRDAAIQLARGIAASQRANGRIPARIAFAARPLSLDTPGPLAERDPTIASLAFLSLPGVGEAGGEPVRRAARRAAAFLLDQQTASGGWPRLHRVGPDRADSARLMLLSDGDYRRSTLALLLAYETFNDPAYRIGVERSVDLLLRMRVNESKSASHLWMGAFDPDGSPTGKMPRFEQALDTAATHEALALLVEVYLVLGSEKAWEGAREAAAALRALRTDSGRWLARYPLRHNELVPVKAAAPPPPPAENPFSKVEPAPATEEADFGLGELLDTIERVSRLGRQAYLKEMGKTSESAAPGLARRLLGLCIQSRGK